MHWNETWKIHICCGDMVNSNSDDVTCLSFRGGASPPPQEGRKWGTHTSGGQIHPECAASTLHLSTTSISQGGKAHLRGGQLPPLPWPPSRRHCSHFDSGKNWLKWFWCPSLRKMNWWNQIWRFPIYSRDMANSEWLHSQARHFASSKNLLN